MKKIACILISVLTVFALAVPAFAGYRDVDPAGWYASDVDYVTEEGIMNGVAEGVFAPEGVLTRAEFVTVLWRLAGEPGSDGKTVFTDLAADWYRAAVVWASESGVVRGVSETEFRPGSALTREQLATLFHRFTSVRGLDAEADGDVASFSDAVSVSDYAKDAVRWAVSRGILRGTGDGRLRPGASATRAQIAAIVRRYALKYPEAFSAVGEKVADFAVRLLGRCRKEGENTLVSPLSVLSALGMAVNGARGDTLIETEGVLGLTKGEINEYISGYVNSLPQGDKYKLSVANSVWCRRDERFAVEPSFIRTVEDLCGADVRTVPFDAAALRAINGWVDEKTDGMIPSILDRIPEEAVMYLINALAFEAEWTSRYQSTDVRKGTFTLAGGSRKQVELMYSDEHLYLSDSKAQGFVKYYYGGKYAFAALLPNTGVTVTEYLGSLTGEGLRTLFDTATVEKVETAIPKFEAEFSADLSRTLQEMGMRRAFNPTLADLGGIGSWKEDGGNLFINRVLHKTFISVAENGTKAGAATAVEVGYATSVGPGQPAPKRVFLTRPFVYMLVDTATWTPFFIGTVEDIGD